MLTNRKRESNYNNSLWNWISLVNLFCIAYCPLLYYCTVCWITFQYILPSYYCPRQCGCHQTWVCGFWTLFLCCFGQGKLQSKVAQVADEKASQDIFEARSEHLKNKANQSFLVAISPLLFNFTIWTKLSLEICRNKSIKNVITIDLHGQHVKHAIRLLKIHLLFGVYMPCKNLLQPLISIVLVFLALMPNEFYLVSSCYCILFVFCIAVKFLRVITGCGSHGVGKSKLKQSVKISAPSYGSHFNMIVLMC